MAVDPIQSQVIDCTDDCQVEGRTLGIIPGHSTKERATDGLWQVTHLKAKSVAYRARAVVFTVYNSPKVHMRPICTSALFDLACIAGGNRFVGLAHYIDSNAVPRHHRLPGIYSSPLEVLREGQSQCEVIAPVGKVAFSSLEIECVSLVYERVRTPHRAREA